MALFVGLKIGMVLNITHSQNIRDIRWVTGYCACMRQMVIARLDAETVAAIADAKRTIAAEHATLLRAAQDAQASAGVRVVAVNTCFSVCRLGKRRRRVHASQSWLITACSPAQRQWS